jgi:hypothetical protein
MYNPSKISNNTLKLRLVRNLSNGLYQLQNAGKEKKKSNVGITWYLTKTGEIITFREWYQSGSPAYIVSGTFEGCQKNKERLENINKGL